MLPSAWARSHDNPTHDLFHVREILREISFQVVLYAIAAAISTYLVGRLLGVAIGLL
jgi:hypothetical protein